MEAFICSGGSFNPVHISHVEMMIKARDLLLSEGYEKVTGFLLCAPDFHVQAKVGTKAALPANTRIRLCSLAISDTGASQWLSVAPEEGCSAPHFLRSLVQDPEIALFNVMGDDLYSRMGGYVGATCGVIVFRRDREEEWEKEEQGLTQGRAMLKPVKKVSSTVIRQRMSDSGAKGVDACSDTLSPSVRKYIKKHKLYSKLGAPKDAPANPDPKQRLKWLLFRQRN